MKYSQRELASLRQIYKDSILPVGQQPPLTDDGDIDLNKINVGAMYIAQNRALGTMLDELLAILKPKPVAKVKTASKAPTKTTTKRR